MMKQLATKFGFTWNHCREAPVSTSSALPPEVAALVAEALRADGDDVRYTPAFIPRWNDKREDLAGAYYVSVYHD